MKWIGVGLVLALGSWLGCATSGPQGEGEVAGLAAPGEAGEGDVLENLLAYSSRSPVCPTGDELVKAKAAFVEGERSRELRAAARMAPASDWKITPQGVSDGSVTLVVGQALPPEVLYHKGVNLLDRWAERWEEFAKNGEDDWEAMGAGLVDQDGFRMLDLEAFDASVQLTNKDNVYAVFPGVGLRTPQGTGLGSTLTELAAAHGRYYMTRVPEPYHCAVTFDGPVPASFLFRDCQRACLGDAALQVYMGGYDGPEDELPWGDMDMIEAADPAPEGEF